MTIENSKISISRAAVIIVFVGGLIANYYTTLNAVKTGISDLRNEMKLEINDLKNENEMLWREMATMQSAMGKAIIPNETRIESKRRR